MMEFNTVIQKIKEVLGEKKERKKILDREVASSLKLDPQYFAVIKKRNKVPYKAIAYFCKEHQVNMNWVLLDQQPKYLV